VFHDKSIAYQEPWFPMLHVDIPSRSDIQRLSAARTSSCLSIYLPTTPITQDAQADRIAPKNLARQADGPCGVSLAAILRYAF
jgi:hypothetical protein